MVSLVSTSCSANPQNGKMQDARDDLSNTVVSSARASSMSAPLNKQNTKKAPRKRAKRDAKVHTCETCKKTIKGTSNYNVHVKEQHGEEKKVKKFECRYCHKSFARKYNRTVHERIHKEYVPEDISSSHSLDQRDKESSSSNATKSPTASGGAGTVKKEGYLGRDHTCEICGAGFVQKSNLRRHISRKHELPWKCPHCSSRFHNALMLLQHNVDAHGGAPIGRIRSQAHSHVCSCNQWFARKSELAAHRQKTGHEEADALSILKAAAQQEGHAGDDSGKPHIYSQVKRQDGDCNGEDTKLWAQAGVDAKTQQNDVSQHSHTRIKVEQSAASDSPVLQCEVPAADAFPQRTPRAPARPVLSRSRSRERSPEMPTLVPSSSSSSSTGSVYSERCDNDPPPLASVRPPPSYPTAETFRRQDSRTSSTESLDSVRAPAKVAPGQVIFDSSGSPVAIDSLVQLGRGHPLPGPVATSPGAHVFTGPAIVTAHPTIVPPPVPREGVDTIASKTSILSPPAQHKGSTLYDALVNASNSSTQGGNPISPDTDFHHRLNLHMLLEQRLRAFSTPTPARSPTGVAIGQPPCPSPPRVSMSTHIQQSTSLATHVLESFIRNLQMSTSPAAAPARQPSRPAEPIASHHVQIPSINSPPTSTSDDVASHSPRLPPSSRNSTPHGSPVTAELAAAREHYVPVVAPRVGHVAPYVAARPIVQQITPPDAQPHSQPHTPDSTSGHPSPPSPSHTTAASAGAGGILLPPTAASGAASPTSSARSRTPSTSSSSSPDPSLRELLGDQGRISQQPPPPHALIDSEPFRITCKIRHHKEFPPPISDMSGKLDQLATVAVLFGSDSAQPSEDTLPPDSPEDSPSPAPMDV